MRMRWQPRLYTLFFLIIIFGGLTLGGCSSAPLNEPAAQQAGEPEDNPAITTSGQPGAQTATPAIQVTESPTADVTAANPLVATAGGDSLGDEYAPELGNSGYDVENYELKLILDPGKFIIDGEASIRAKSLLRGLSSFSLDFVGFEISNLEVDGQAAKYERRDKKLIIELPVLLDMGEAFEVKVVYSGAPVVEPSRYVGFLGSLGMFFPGGTIFTLSEPDGARYWYPNNDHPKDKALFTFELAVPNGYTGVANGTLMKKKQEGDWTVFRWEHDFPMAPYLAVAAVGNYELIESTTTGGILIRNYVYPELREAFELATVNSGEALDWMVDLYGPYPFEAFGFVTSRLVSMASETQTMVVIPETSLNEETVIHEIAHMWFGNMVSLESWKDMWLKEGPAIYTYLMWQTRENPETLDIFMEDLTARVLEKSSSYPLNGLPPASLLSYDSYWRGAVLFHALRKEVGDEAYFGGLRAYLEQFVGETASAVEFQAVMEETAGKDLDNFFSSWLAAP